MFKKSLAFIPAYALTLIIVPMSTQAALVTYNYIGNNVDTASAPYTISDFVSASITVDCSLLSGAGDCSNLSYDSIVTAVTTWSISAGSVTITDTDTGFPSWASSRISISTNASSDIDFWSLNMFGLPTLPAAPGYGSALYDRLDTSNTPSGIKNDAASSNAAPVFARLDNNPGQWTVENTSTVPIPAAAWLFCSAIAGLIGFRVKRA